MNPMILLIVVFAVMMIPMLLMSSRQRKMQRQQQELVARLGIGDEVRTHSGFYGLIVEELGDTVILESEDGSQLKWARAAIAMKVDPVDGTPDVPLEDEEDAATEGHDHAAADLDASDREQVRDEAALAEDDRPVAAHRADSVPGVTTADERR